MFRLFVIALIVSVAVKLISKRWPWQFLSTLSPREHALQRARRLLGVSPGADRGKIVEAHKKLVSMVHPDRGGTNEQVHEANAARDLLLDEAERYN